MLEDNNELLSILEPISAHMNGNYNAWRFNNPKALSYMEAGKKLRTYIKEKKMNKQPEKQSILSVIFNSEQAKKKNEESKLQNKTGVCFCGALKYFELGKAQHYINNVLHTKEACGGEESIEDLAKKLNMSAMELKHLKQHIEGIKVSGKTEPKKEEIQVVFDSAYTPHENQKEITSLWEDYFTKKNKEVKTSESVSYWMTRITDPSSNPDYSTNSAIDEFGSGFSGERLRKQMIKFKQEDKKNVLFQIQEPKKTVIGKSMQLPPQWYLDLVADKKNLSSLNGMYHIGSSMVDHKIIKDIPEVKAEDYVLQSKLKESNDFWRNSNTRFRKNRSYGINYDLDIFGQELKIKHSQAKIEVGMTLGEMMEQIDEEEMGRNKMLRENNNKIAEVLEVL